MSSGTSHSQSARRPSGSARRCTKSGCVESAAKTLIYIYADSTAVLGPLSTYSEPHSFDFCHEHSERLTVPRGWTVIRHEDGALREEPRAEDLMAIADAVREVANQDLAPRKLQPEVGRRGHLRVLPTQE
jgi:hypothetical protein